MPSRGKAKRGEDSKRRFPRCEAYLEGSEIFFKIRTKEKERGDGAELKPEITRHTVKENAKQGEGKLKNR